MADDKTVLDRLQRIEAELLESGTFVYGSFGATRTSGLLAFLALVAIGRSAGMKPEELTALTDQGLELMDRSIAKGAEMGTDVGKRIDAERRKRGDDRMELLELLKLKGES
jgi:hypothetical protein